MNKLPLTTLCYIENEDSYLMMHRIKKVNDINKDKWIGVGGHFEPGESRMIVSGGKFWEETGLTSDHYRLRGIITFTTTNWPTEYMFLYTATADTRSIAQCSEGELVWIPQIRNSGSESVGGDKIFFRLLEEERICSP